MMRVILTAVLVGLLAGCSAAESKEANFAERVFLLSFVEAASPYLQCSGQFFAEDGRLHQPKYGDGSSWTREAVKDRIDKRRTAVGEMHSACGFKEAEKNVRQIAAIRYPELSPHYRDQQASMILRRLESMNQELMSWNDSTQNGLPIVAPPPVIAPKTPAKQTN